MTNGLMRELPNCSSSYLLVLCDISSSICSHIVSGYLLSCNPLNPDRQEKADLYSSGPPNNVTVWKERKSEWTKNMWAYLWLGYISPSTCAFWVCTSLPVCAGLLLLHILSTTQTKLLSLFMREEVNNDLLLFLVLTDSNGGEINCVGPRFISYGLMTPEQLGDRLNNSLC